MGAAIDYEAFIANRSQVDFDSGFAPVWLPSFLFDFQRSLVEWAIRKGRAAIFADCGMGKTPMQLVWAENVVRHTGKRVLILTPLAVAGQTVSEAHKFGIEAHRSVRGELYDGIVVTNYERLHHFSPADFAGVVCDESSILKSFDGVTKAAVTEFMRTLPYRLLCTATAAPNDYVELGTSSEALGYLGHMDMLGRFFVNQNGNATDTKGHWKGHSAPRAYESKLWRFKGHAEVPFWRWVASWARSLRKPSDLGFDDGHFALPDLVERETVVSADRPREGLLFSLPAVGLAEEREERRRTMRERCERAAAIVADTRAPAVMWCHLNPEGDLLERLVPDAIQVSGSDSDDEKEEKFAAFSSGQARVLVTKGIIGAWGLNWQHCAHMTMFASHSFEQYYQSVRRCWRYGQTRNVVVDHIRSDGEGRVMDNLRRKSAAADRMFAELVRHMRDGMAIDRSRHGRVAVTLPGWITKKEGV